MTPEDERDIRYCLDHMSALGFSKTQMKDCIYYREALPQKGDDFVLMLHSAHGQWRENKANNTTKTCAKLFLYRMRERVHSHVRKAKTEERVMPNEGPVCRPDGSVYDEQGFDDLLDWLDPVKQEARNKAEVRKLLDGIDSQEQRDRAAARKLMAELDAHPASQRQGLGTFR